MFEEFYWKIERRKTESGLLLYEQYKLLTKQDDIIAAFIVKDVSDNFYKLTVYSAAWKLFPDYESCEEDLDVAKFKAQLKSKEFYNKEII